MSVLVVGSVALDSVVTPFGENKEALGGSAIYFALSASLFTKVNLVAVVGSDFPKRYIPFLENRGIDLKGLEIKEGKTFRWCGEYGYDLNNARTISTDLGVFSHYNFHIPKGYRQSEHLFLANIDPDIQKDILGQVKRPKLDPSLKRNEKVYLPRLVASDSMNYWIENKRKELLALLKEVDLFMINDSEARELTKEHNLIEAAAVVSSFGPRMLVIKKGEHGALLFLKKNFCFSAPAYPLENVFDPTGCGDSFAGGFIGYLAQQKEINESNLRKAVIYGSIIASYNAESFGIDRLTTLTIGEIEERVKEFKRLTQF